MDGGNIKGASPSANLSTRYQGTTYIDLTVDAVRWAVFFRAFASIRQGAVLEE